MGTQRKENSLKEKKKQKNKSNSTELLFTKHKTTKHINNMPLTQ